METWHYLENQFDTVTRNSRKRMNSIAADTGAKLNTGAQNVPAIAPIRDAFTSAKTTWDATYQAWANAKATYRSATAALDILFASLRETPSHGERSKVDRWESRVAAEWAKSHPVYIQLFPLGREPLTTGSREQIIGAVQQLGTRLQAKSTDATLSVEQQTLLTSLATEVADFHGQLESARNRQQEMEGLVDTTAATCESQRLEMATILYATLAQLMALYPRPEERMQVVGYFDLTLIMAPPQADNDEPEPAPEPERAGAI